MDTLVNHFVALPSPSRPATSLSRATAASQPVRQFSKLPNKNPATTKTAKSTDLTKRPLGGTRLKAPGPPFLPRTNSGNSDVRSQISDSAHSALSKTLENIGPIQVTEIVLPTNESECIAHVGNENESDHTPGGPSRHTSPQVPTTTAVVAELHAMEKRLEGLENLQTGLVSSTRRSRGSSLSTTSLTEERVQQLLNDRDQQWESRWKLLEEKFERRIQDLEERLAQQMRATLAAVDGQTPALMVTSETPVNSNLGKRSEMEQGHQLQQTPGAGPSNHQSNARAAKRMRMDRDGSTVDLEDEREGDSDVQSPHTPSPPTVANGPRTPSPGHQGVLPDMSRTPGIGNDFFDGPPPQFATSAHKRRQSDGDESIASGLAYPLFATTPRPTEPQSPTLDAPPSVSRARVPHFARGSTLTPGRKRVSPAPRAVSDAHKELSTITESDEPPVGLGFGSGSIGSLARRRVASADVSLLPTVLRGSSVGLPVSPPQLSPSPSIGLGEKEGFTYTPFPPVPGRRAVSTSQAQSTSRPTLAQSIESNTPKRASGMGRFERSPSTSETAGGRLYSNYRAGPNDALTMDMETPGHRTMLGTETYRDTRFGDVPVVEWGTPNIDLGPNTPGSILGSARR